MTIPIGCVVWILAAVLAVIYGIYKLFGGNDF